MGLAGIPRAFDPQLVHGRDQVDEPRARQVRRTMDQLNRTCAILAEPGLQPGGAGCLAGQRESDHRLPGGLVRRRRQQRDQARAARAGCDPVRDPRLVQRGAAADGQRERAPRQPTSALHRQAS